MKVVLHLLIVVTKTKSLAVKLDKKGVEVFTILYLQLTVILDNLGFFIVLAVDTLEVPKNCLGRSEQVVDITTGREVVFDIGESLTICSRTDSVDYAGGILCPVGRIFDENVVDLKAPCLVVLTVILTAEELLVRVLGRSPYRSA